MLNIRNIRSELKKRSELKISEVNRFGKFAKWGERGLEIMVEGC